MANCTFRGLNKQILKYMCFEYQRCAGKENQTSVMNYEKPLKLHIISGQGNTIPFQVIVEILYGVFSF